MFVTLMSRYDSPVTETAWSVDRPTAVATRADAPRHPALVRVTHWLTALCFLALLVSGLEIVVSHPRFYWGESGNVLTPALFSIPIPSSRGTVPTGYGYVLPDQNGWSRYLHFEAAWVLVLTGALYVIWGASSGHFRNELLPEAADRSMQAFSRTLARHLRFARPAAADAWSYNVVQRLTYLLVIFVLFPLVIWTGLAMSPAFVSAVPSTVTMLGGRQSARTLHFLVTLALVAFLLVHVAMVWLAGFGTRVMAMITGAPASPRGPE
jgi:thiosulfate reductase cytochrome b subunit